MNREEHQYTKHDIIERLNFRILLDPSREDFNFNLSQSAIAMAGAMAVLAFTCLIFQILQVGLVLQLVSAFGLLFEMFMFRVVTIWLMDYNVVVARHGFVLYVTFSAPYLWIYTGRDAIGIIWMMFAIIFAVTALDLKTRVYFVCGQLIFYISMIIVLYNGLISIHSISDVKYFTIVVTSLIAFSVYTITVIRRQTKLSIEVMDNLIKTRELLNDSLDKQRIFSASMHHELRNPLNGIMGILQMMKLDESYNDEQIKHISAAYDSSTTLLHIVNDLLDYSKVEAGKFEVVSNDFNLGNIKANAEKMFSAMAKEKGLALTITIKEGTPLSLRSDESRIQQVLFNFISNAIKYSNEGRVTVDLKVEENTLFMRVEDTGEGMSAAAKEVLFIPYTRINEESHGLIQGTGLGLYIVKSIITALQGTVNVESEVGKGSVFSVEIPVEILEKQESMRSSEVIDEIPDLSKLRILAVDDTKMNLVVFKGILKNTGIEVITATSGEEALKIVKTDKNFDLIFLDHLMPNMDGVQLFGELRKCGIMVPIYILTANSDKIYDELYKSTGFEAKINKPVQAMELYALLKKYV